MDYARAFTFVTEDKNWVTKLIVGAVISFFSFLILPLFFLIGYMVAVTRQVLNHQELPLPEWDNWGELFKDGIIIEVAGLVYTLPFWLLLCIGSMATVGFSFLSGEAPDLASAGMLATWGLIGCLVLIFAIALLFITPAIIIQYVRHNEFAACFRFGEVLGIARANIVPILISALALVAVVFVLSLVTGFVSFIIPCIGGIIGWLISMLLTPYIMIATGHLYGQIGRNSSDKAPAY